MLKVKSWLDKGRQFTVKEIFASKNPKTVQRIKDDAILTVGRQDTFGYFKIIQFYDDFIHVLIKVHSKTHIEMSEFVKCEINDIKLSDDGSKIISWPGMPK